MTSSGLKVVGLRFLTWGPINLSFGAGEIVGLSGPSGAGKSLLLRAIADLVESTGRVVWGGLDRETLAAPEWRRLLGLLPANPVWWYDRVGDHFLGNRSHDLDTLNLADDVMTWEVSRLSSGERQRLGILRMLNRSPECLLLDEPTANLDPDARDRVVALLRDYVNDRSAARSALIVSHDLGVLEELCVARYEMLEHQLRPVSLR